jgi:hypothetical protein
MMWIELVVHMSGTRANDARYPPSSTPFRVEDWEGINLIGSGVAREVAAPAPEPESRQPAAFKRPAYMPPPAQDEPAEPEPVVAAEDPEPAEEPDDDRGRPAPGDSKQAWVDYAISKGEGWDQASRMTKADLQSKYGGRL